MDQISKRDLKMVYQFLVGNNFESTAGALITEALNKGFTNLERDKNNKDFANVREQIILHFKEGDQKNFFKLWNLCVPEDAKETKEYKILTLNLHVHFAMLPKRIMLAQSGQRSKQRHKMEFPNDNISESKEIENFITEIEKNVSDNMDQLQQYLNTTGKELECETQLRPFFALPFIEDPYAEPFLSKIFNESWLDELMENLRVFIEKHKQNFKNSSEVTRDDENSNKSSSVCESLLAERRENTNSSRKVVLKNNIPIVPNDRDIPVFLEDSEIGEEHILSNSVKCNRISKSTQTHVRGIQFLTNVYKDDANDKRLIQYTQELAVTKSHLCTVHSNYEKLKVRFHKLHADYHKLISVAGELTAALENSVKGQTVDLQAMLETCIKIFPDLFNQNIRDGSQIYSASQLDKFHIHARATDHSTSDITSVSPKLLDFKKVKSHLINGSIKTKLFLLQALRRKITLGQPGERDEAVHEYISKDLLGLHGQIASDNGKSILPYLLAPGNITPHPLQQSAARLLNVLASFRCGRDYLSYGSIVVDVILKCLNNASNNDVDAITCNMMIAMLQKLSLRKQQRIYMIDNGLVEWLIHHLHDDCRIMDSYRLEYATALLMNLSLHRVAQRRASVMASLLISTLLTLLAINHAPAIPYVNGALNNFLTNRTINDEAKEMNLASALEYYRKNKTGEIQKHFDHILRIHRGESTVEIEGEETADDDNEEFDVLETELEENDPVRNCTSELSGEMLLAACYAFSPKTIQERTLIADASPLKNYRIHTIRVHDNQRQDVISCDDHQSAACNRHFLPRSRGRNCGRRRHPDIALRQVPSESTALRPKFPPRIPASLPPSLKVPTRKPVKNEERRSSLSVQSNARNSVQNVSTVYQENGIHIDDDKSLKNVLQDSRHSITFGKLFRSNEKLEKSKEALGVLVNRFDPVESREKIHNRISRPLCNKNVEDTLNHPIKPYNGSAIYLYANQTSKESSKTTIGSSTILTPVRESGRAEPEKLSSIASLYNVPADKNPTDSTPWTDQQNFDNEEAFLAKPRLSRTPPRS